MIGYRVLASDGPIGQIDDFIVDDVSWTLRYFIVDTHGCLDGRSVLTARRWTDGISWARGQVVSAISRQMVQDSPEYRPGIVLNQASEELLARGYRRARAARRTIGCRV